MRFVNSATPRWVIIVGDLVLSMFALGLSYLIRFDLNTNLSSFKNEWEQNWKSVLLYLVIKLSVFQLFSIHKGLIRHTSAQDTKRILNAALCCTGIFIGISIYRATLLNTTYLFPSSIILLEFIISECEHSTVSVMDQNDFFGTEQALADCQGSDFICGNYSTGITNYV